MAGSRNYELMKNTIILSIGRILPKLIALFVLPLLTTYLTKKDYGLYELTLSVASFCIPLLSVQIQEGVFRFLIDRDSDKKALITGSFLFITIMFAISATPIVTGWALYTHDMILGMLFFGSYLAEVMLTWAGQVTRGLGNNLNYSIAYIIYSVVFVFILILFLLGTKKLTVKDVAVAMTAAYVCAFVFLLVKTRIYSYFEISQKNRASVKMLLGYSAPMVISAVALWAVNLSDRFIVSGFLGIEVTATYSVANRIPNLFSSMYNIFNLAWTENTSKLTVKEKQEGYYTAFFGSFFKVMVGMMLTLISISPLLFRILINSKYSDSYGLMPWLYVGVFFSSLVAFLGSVYVGEKRTKNVAVTSAVGAIINILINLLLMKRFGVIIAALSTIVSYLIIFTYRAIDIKKYVNISYQPMLIIGGVTIVCGIAAINYSFSPWGSVISIGVAVLYNVAFNRTVIIKICKRKNIRS